MMKMVTGEGSPLRQDAGTGLDWFSMATEASGSGTPDLLCSPMFLGYIDIYRQKKSVKGATRGPSGWGHLSRGAPWAKVGRNPAQSGLGRHSPRAHAARVEGKP